MKIKIATQTVGVEFGMLEPGDVFEHDGEFYIKITDVCHINNKAISLQEGMVTDFGPKTICFPKDATLTIK